MKRSILLIVALIGCLMLCGCEDASASVTNGGDAIITVGGKKVTKSELYNVLSKQDQGKTALRLATNYIVDQEVATTPELEQKAQEALQAVKDKYKENFEDLLKYEGYQSEEEYVEKVVMPTVKQTELAGLYIEENWEAVIERYYPTKVKIIETTTTEDANKALQEVKNGAVFEDVADKYSTKSHNYYDGREHLLSRADEKILPTLINSYLRENDTPGVSAIIQNDKMDRFYVVQIINGNPNQFKEEAVELIRKQSDLEGEYMAYYFKKYNFKVYDIDFYNQIKASYPTYLNQ